MDILQKYYLIENPALKIIYLEKVGIKPFLIEVFDRESRTVIPFLLDLIDQWSVLNFQDWKDILMQIRKNEIAVIYSFIPFCWQFLKINILPELLDSDQFSEEVKERANQKYYREGKLKEQWIRSYLLPQEKVILIKDKLDIIHQKLIKQGAKILPETIKDKSFQERKKTMLISPILKQFMEEKPELFKIIFPDEVITKEQIKRFVNSLDEEKRKILMERFGGKLPWKSLGFQ